MKVLMFGWELPPYNSGGLGVACYGLTQAMSAQGADITFVLPQSLPVRADFMKIVFADIKDVSLGSPYYSAALSGVSVENNLAWDYLTAARKYAIRAVDIAKKYPHDIVHAHDWLCFGAGIAAAETSGRPLVTHVHATEYDRSASNSVNSVVYQIEKEGLSRSDAVIAVSRFTKNLLSRHYAARPDSVHVVHNGINPDEFSDAAYWDNPLTPLKNSGFKIVLYVGRITLQKGPDYFIKAAEQVIRYDPKVAFVVVGSGDMERQIIEQTARAGISDHVFFAGFLRGQLLKDIFRHADLFVMPSVSEPYGITALESVASGTPALISRQSGVSENLTHALKVDFWDTEEMTNQILSALRYPSLHRALEVNGRREVQKISWGAAASKVLDIYRRVLSSPRPAYAYS